jgi:hypothetical protein
VAAEEDLLVAVIATEVVEEIKVILNPEEAIVRLNLEEEDLINLLKDQAEEDHLILEVQANLQEEAEAEKRTFLVL